MLRCIQMKSQTMKFSFGAAKWFPIRPFRLILRGYNYAIPRMGKYLEHFQHYAS